MELQRWEEPVAELLSDGQSSSFVLLRCYSYMRSPLFSLPWVRSWLLEQHTNILYFRFSFNTNPTICSSSFQLSFLDRVYCWSETLWPTHEHAHTLPHTIPSELNTTSTSAAFVKLLFAFSWLLVSTLVISLSSLLSISILFFYVVFFASTVVERIAGIHSNMFARVHIVSVCVCVVVRACDLRV